MFKTWCATAHKQTTKRRKTNDWHLRWTKPKPPSPSYNEVPCSLCSLRNGLSEFAMNLVHCLIAVFWQMVFNDNTINMRWTSGSQWSASYRCLSIPSCTCWFISTTWQLQRLTHHQLLQAQCNNYQQWVLQQHQQEHDFNAWFLNEVVINSSNPDRKYDCIEGKKASFSASDCSGLFQPKQNKMTSRVCTRN